MACQHITLSRRETLVGIAVCATVPAIPAAALAGQPVNVDRAAWESAMQTYIKAKREFDDFDPIHSRIFNACQNDEAALPHVTFRPDPYTGNRQPVSTADRNYIMHARKLVADVKAGKCHLETERYDYLREHWALSQEVAAAADKRDADIQSIRNRHGMDAADEKIEALIDRMDEAHTQLMYMPAPDAAALNFKLEYLLQIENGSTAGYSAFYVEQTKDDMRRILGGAA